MTQLYCLQYFGPLEDFISAEKAIIARIDFVIIILKLKFNNNFNHKLFKSICEHSILLPQN